MSETPTGPQGRERARPYFLQALKNFLLALKGGTTPQPEPPPKAPQQRPYDFQAPSPHRLRSHRLITLVSGVVLVLIVLQGATAGLVVWTDVMSGSHGNAVILAGFVIYAIVAIIMAAFLAPRTWLTQLLPKRSVPKPDVGRRHKHREGEAQAEQSKGAPSGSTMPANRERPRPVPGDDVESTRSEAVHRAPAPLLIGSANSALSGHHGQLGPAWSYAASVIGQNHVAVGAVREDAYALACPEATVGVAAVADGVGSSQDAHVAAHIAAHIAAEQTSEWATAGEAMSWSAQSAAVVRDVSAALHDPECITQWRQGLAYVAHPAQTRRDKTRNPATTLATAALRTTGTDVVVVYWFAYGDAAVLKFTQGSWVWVSGTPNQVSSTTPALPGPDRHLRSGWTDLHRSELLVLATDGFTEAIEAHPGELGRVVTLAVEQRVSAAKFCTLLDFEIPGLFDDKTLVVLTQ